MPMDAYTYTLETVAFDLDSTLDCGQTFRWYKDGKGWFGVVFDRVVRAQQHGNTLKILTNKPWSHEEIREYFGMEDDLETVRETLLKKMRAFSERTDKVLEEAFKHSWGLRILRQDPYEITVSFLFSIQTSIPQIQKKLERLARLFTENRVNFQGKEVYFFPSLDQVRELRLSDWRSLGLGFRSEWIYSVVQRIGESFFQRLTKLSLSEKLQELVRVRGVGYKVASCIALFGYGELNAFPVDVWVRKVMGDLFGLKGSTKKLMERGMEFFKPFAGYAQEYLFREYRMVRRLEKS